MKKIFLYVNCEYINRNYALVVKELKKQSGNEIEFIDVNEILKDDLFGKLRQAELILLDHSIIFALNFYRAEDLLTYYKSMRSADFYFDLVDAILKLEIPVIYIQSMVDIHNTAIYEFDRFFDSIQGIVWLYHNEPPKLESIPAELRDDWMMKHDCPNGNWSEIFKKVPSKFQMLHCLSEHEYKKSIKNYYKWDISVCGERYMPRRKVMQSFKQDKTIQVAPYRRNDLFICGVSRMLTALKVPARWINPNFIKVRQQHQEYILKNSLASFTCGSAYNYPVRKFFEIPAAQSLLLAYPFSGMEQCGYKHEANFIKVSNLEEAYEQVSFLKRNIPIAKKIIRNCFEMAYDLHHLQTRVQHLKKFIALVAQGQNVVAEFSSGEFVFNHEN